MESPAPDDIQAPAPDVIPVPAPDVAYRSSRPLVAALIVLNTLTVAGVAFLIVADGGWRGTWITGAAAAYAVASLLISWLILRVSGRSLVIHPAWFDYRTSGEWLMARWDQVDALYATPAGVTGHRGLLGRYEYRIVVSGRRVDAGTAVSADAELGRIVAERTHPHLLDRSIGRLRAGRPVHFGRLTLEPDRLVVHTWPTRRIDLDRVTGHHLAGRRLILDIKGTKRPMQVPLARLPNARVFIDLLDHRPDWQGGPGRRSSQRPKSALAKNQTFDGRSAMRLVRYGYQESPYGTYTRSE